VRAVQEKRFVTKFVNEKGKKENRAGEWRAPKMFTRSSRHFLHDSAMLKVLKTRRGSCRYFTRTATTCNGTQSKLMEPRRVILSGIQPTGVPHVRPFAVLPSIEFHSFRA